jgi:hypothetical protein
MKTTSLLALSLLLAVTACSGKTSANGGGTTAQASPGTAAAVSTGAQPAAAAAPASMPVYPGATKLAQQFNKPLTFCKHKMTVTVYHVPHIGADQVAQWYLGRMPGASKIQVQKPESNGTGSVSYLILNSDGGSAATINEMHYGSLEKSAARFGMADRTTIGLSTYDPPFSSEDVVLFKQGAVGDPSAKAQATARLRSECGSDALSTGG